MSTPTDEITREQAIQNLLNDQAFSGLTLKGSDDVLIPTNRSMLAARSPVFHSMLCGEFSEAKSSTVSLNYESPVLRAIVEYIYTDGCEVLLKTEHDAESVRTLMGLADAANYFGLPKLCQETQACSFALMRSRPSLACAFLVHCEAMLSSVSPEIERKARQVIRSNAARLLDDLEPIASLTGSILESILSEDKIEADEYTLFLILKAWADSGDESEKRVETASQLTTSLALDRIDPSQLSTVVQASGLVSHEQLFEAYKKQALDSEQQHSLSWKRPRFSRTVWETSNDVVARVDEENKLELLQCPALRAGLVHKWTIDIEEKSLFCPLAVGIASTIRPPDLDDPLGSDEGGWGYFSNAKIAHNEKLHKSGTGPVAMKFRQGSQISFVLDLRETRNRTGTLSVSVDGGPSVLLFSDLLSHIRGQAENGGFVPAVSSSQGIHRVRLVQGPESVVQGPEGVQ